MRRHPTYNRWTQFIETLRKKWISFGNGIVLALSEEEMKIRREELEKQIVARSERD
jgi:hypothetical protein